MRGAVGRSANAQARLPAKLSGSAAAIEAGWATSAGSPAVPMSSSTTTSAKRQAVMLTAAKRAACGAGAASPAWKVQWRLHAKLLAIAMATAAAAAMRWCAPSASAAANATTLIAKPVAPTRLKRRSWPS